MELQKNNIFLNWHHNKFEKIKNDVFKPVCGEPAMSLYSHTVPLVQWSTVCFPSWGTRVQSPRGYLCEAWIPMLALSLSCYIGDPDVIDHCDLVWGGIAKGQLIILRRTAQSKDSTATSRMCCVAAPLRQLGLRSYPEYSLNSARSRGKKLVFPQLRQFLELQLFCQMSLHGKNFSVDNIYKNLSKNLWMLLLLLFLANKIWAACCLRSCQPTSSMLPSSGCTSAASSPLQQPYDSPHAVLHHGPHSFTIRVGSREEIISVSHLKACTDVWQTASPRRSSQAGRHPHRRSCCYQAGLVFRPTNFSTFNSGAAKRWSRNCFSPTLQGVFARPGPWG